MGLCLSPCGKGRGRDCREPRGLVLWIRQGAGAGFLLGHTEHFCQHLVPQPRQCSSVPPMRRGQEQRPHFRPCPQKPAHRSLPLSPSWLKGDTPSTRTQEKPQSVRSREARATVWNGVPSPATLCTGLRRRRHTLFYVRPLRFLGLLDDATHVAHLTVTCTDGPSLGEGGGPEVPSPARPHNAQDARQAAASRPCSLHRCRD